MKIKKSETTTQMMVVAVMIMSINVMLLDLDLVAFMNRLDNMMVLDVSCIKDDGVWCCLCERDKTDNDDKWYK